MSPDAAAAELLRLASVAAQVAETRDAFVAALDEADVTVIARALPGMGSTGTTGAKMDACRDAARAVVERKPTDRTVESMNSLGQAADRLAKVGNRIMFVGVLVAIPSAALAVLGLYHFFGGAKP